MSIVIQRQQHYDSASQGGQMASTNFLGNQAVIVVDRQNKVFTNCLKLIAIILDENVFEIANLDAATGILPGEPHIPLFIKNRSPVSERPAEKIDNSQGPWWTRIRNSSDLPCKLPCFFLTDEPFICYAGLCTVVRNMVHHVSSLDVGGKSKVLSLLGYQETCLKAYAEISTWTKFCEVDFPKAIENLDATEQLENKEDILDGKKTLIMIPFVLQKLEKELRTPKNLPNKSKYVGKERKRWLSRLVHESFEGTTLSVSVESYLDKILHEVDEGQSWSPYLNGYQITIADIIILVMVSQLISKLSRRYCLCNLPERIPSVVSWMKTMKNIPKNVSLVDDTLASLIPKEHSFDGNKSKGCCTWKYLNADIDSVSQTKLEQKNKKIKVNHQGGIKETLQRMKKLGIVANISPLSEIPPDLNWSAHPEFVNPSAGDLNAERSLRKQQQIVNILTAVTPLVLPGCRIVDFCAGGGHVGIVLAYFLPECEVILVENKEKSVSRAVARIKALKLTNVQVCHSNLDYFSGSFDIGVSLHACGVATDLVLNACYKERASFVICPCCYGGINNMESLSYPRSSFFHNRVHLNDYMILSHSSDMTTWEETSEKCQLGKASMLLIDFDRCKLMEELGYKTALRLMVPSSCSPKNHLLIGSLI